MFGIEHLLDAPALIVRVPLDFVHQEPTRNAQQDCGGVHIDGNYVLRPCRQRHAYLLATRPTQRDDPA